MPPTRTRVAAFFDLDKTVIAKASMAAFGRTLYRGGLLNRRIILRAAWSQLVFLHLGASEEKLATIREKVLRLTKGWDKARVSALVREAIDEVVEPIIYAEAAELIEYHRELGHLIVIAAPPAAATSATARAPTIGTSGGQSRRTMDMSSARPAGALHVRPWRPRPARCSPAVTSVPCGAPAAASARATVLVESVTR